MCNFHVLLPDEVYRDLREEASHFMRPATVLVRQASEAWLRQRRKVVRHEAIATFATEYANTELDLDMGLEAASVEHLISSEKSNH